MRNIKLFRVPRRMTPDQNSSAHKLSFVWTDNRTEGQSWINQFIPQI